MQIHQIQASADFVFVVVQDVDLGGVREIVFVLVLEVRKVWKKGAVRRSALSGWL